MHPFLSAVIGGALIGFSVVLLMFLSGRIAGISGIVGGLLPPKVADDWPLRLAFIAGLLLAPLILSALAGFNGIGAPTVGLAILIPAGFLMRKMPLMCRHKPFTQRVSSRKWDQRPRSQPEHHSLGRHRQILVT